MIVFTRKVGVFKFEKGTVLSHAKRICDDIQGRILTPDYEHGEQPLTTEQECYDFVMTKCGNVLNSVPFKVILR